jgi:hypothetical protein
LEQLRHCLSVLISARQDVDGSPEGSICVVVCRTEIGCGSAAASFTRSGFQPAGRFRLSPGKVVEHRKA